LYAGISPKRYDSNCIHAVLLRTGDVLANRGPGRSFSSAAEAVSGTYRCPGQHHHPAEYIVSNFQGEKARRTAQVQLELSQETSKPTIDAMALGVRYLELEAIRRELKSEQDKVLASIQNVLTPAQKAKLQALQQAMLLQSTICEAQAMNLLGQPQLGTPFLTLGPVLGGLLPYPAPVGSFIYGPATSCTPAFRNGDFSGLVPPPTQLP
jgi:hypothetical protein